jgi:AcrR family transcriptional regulator
MTGSGRARAGPAPAGTDGIDRGDGADDAGETGSRGRPRQARGVATRRSILVAASEQFARYGFHGTSLDVVLTAAGVTKGSLYFHFDGKAALAEAVIAQMLAGWESVTAHVVALDVDPLTMLLATTDQVVVVISEDPIARGGIRLLDDPALPSLAADGLYAAGETQLTHLFTAAASGELLRPGLDPARIARSVMAQLAGHALMAERTPNHTDLWDCVTDMWMGILPAVAAQDWLDGWSATDWARRPRPDPATLD